MSENDKQGGVKTPWSPGDSGSVLRALAAWDATSLGMDSITVEQLAQRMGVATADVPQLAKSVHRLVEAGYLEAHKLTNMGSTYHEYMITGLTLAGETAAKTSR